jgi:hypothetical protein
VGIFKYGTIKASCFSSIAIEPKTGINGLFHFGLEWD